MITRTLLAACSLASLAFAAAREEISVAVPPGWSAQPDPASHATYMKPPDAASIRDAALVVFPSVAFAGTAEQFHQQTLAAAIGVNRLREPLRQGRSGGFLVSGVHCLTPQGADVRMILYTARWGSRAQAVVWAADRMDLFVNDGAAASAAMQQAEIPEATPTSPAAGANPSTPISSPAVPAAPNPPAAGTAADTADTMPVLEYKDPPNFWRAGVGGKIYTEYQGTEVNFQLCVYPFREYRGDIRTTFQQTLLRDWLDVLYREESLAGPPRIAANSLPGADTVIDAHFADNRQQEHHRILIVSGRWAALVDMTAPTAFAWQKASPSAFELLKSMHVGRKQAPPSLAQGPGPAGAKLAGLFQAFKSKFVVNLQLGPGYGGSKLALHYYLFSADGHVYRCYDFPPGGSEASARQFDFDAAQRQDPENSGRYAVRGNELYIRMGGPQPDEITTTLTDWNTIQLDTISYERKP